MVTRDLGFFRELPHGDPAGPSLLKCAEKGDPQIQCLVADYLEAGAMLASTAQRVFDVLSKEEIDTGLLAIRTDGAWMWPADLPYYVRKYNISLPEDFISHGQSLGWSTPVLSQADLLLIEREMFPE